MTVELGKLITDTAQRDAVHVAVIPVMADEDLQPGAKVSVVGYSTLRARLTPPAVGVVDPFLAEPVKRGQFFWLFLLPGSTSPPRHHWTHPAFPDEVSEDYDSDGCGPGCG